MATTLSAAAVGQYLQGPSRWCAMLCQARGSAEGHRRSKQYCVTACAVALLVGVATVLQRGVLPHNLYLSSMFGCPGPAQHPQPRLEPWNVAYAERLATEVREADAAQGYDVVFYGDSITETWRGSDQDQPSPRCAGVPEIFQRHFGTGKGRRAQVLAIGGDQVANLAWRLMNGQTYVNHAPKVSVVMIGTNDLGFAACFGGEPNITAAAPGTVARLQGVLQFLRLHNPATRVVLVSQLPRGGLLPATRYAWPSDFTPGLTFINEWQRQAAALQPFVEYADCAGSVLRDGKISPEVMPDALHPLAAGMESLAQCLAPIIDRNFE